MTESEHARWNDWAKRIARGETLRATKLILDATKEGLFKATDPLAARIAEVEREVAAMKQRQPAPSEEWPLRSIQGGKR